MNPGSRQLVQQVRNGGVVVGDSRQLAAQEIMEHAPVNRAPLPISPKLKNIKTGVVFTWTKAMARRHDLFVNCDENGNENPASWQGRAPAGWKYHGGQEPNKETIPPAPTRPPQAQPAAGAVPPDTIYVSQAVEKFNLINPRGLVKDHMDPALRGGALAFGSLAEYGTIDEATEAALAAIVSKG